MMQAMTLQSFRRIAACLLGRCVLAWFALSMGAAVASPLVQPHGFELICTSTGAVKLIVIGDDGSSDHIVLGAGHLDCPMCLPHAAPPPPALQLPPPAASLFGMRFNPWSGLASRRLPPPSTARGPPLLESEPFSALAQT